MRNRDLVQDILAESIAIKMTPFIFEDGMTYSFEIYKSPSDTEYFDLYVYRKTVTKILWWKCVRYESINECPRKVKLFNGGYNEEIKWTIKNIIIEKSTEYKIKGWDGFVGNVPQEIKAAHKRDSKISDLIGEESHHVRSRIFRANSGSSD